MLWAIFVILLILWLLGFSLHIAGSLIHILLVVAVVVLIINLVSGRRADCSRAEFLKKTMNPALGQARW